MLTVSLDCTFFNVPLTFLSNVYSTFCEYNLINLSDIAEIVLKVALNTIKQTSNLNLSEKKITHKMYNNFWNMSDKAHTFILHLGIKSYQISPLSHAPFFYCSLLEYNLTKFSNKLCTVIFTAFGDVIE